MTSDYSVAANCCKSERPLVAASCGCWLCLSSGHDKIVSLTFPYVPAISITISHQSFKLVAIALYSLDKLDMRTLL